MANDWVYSGDIALGDLVKNSSNDSSLSDKQNMQNGLIAAQVKSYQAPIKADVFTSGGSTKIAMNLNLAASVRIENMKFGSRDSGPVAIDGAKLNYLSLRLQTSPSLPPVIVKQ